jgi:hypothetical protein
MSATATVLPSPDPFRHALTFAISEVIVGFQIDTPHLFDFSGLFTATSHVESLANLQGPGSLDVFRSPAMSSGQVRESGLLPAGSWALVVHQRANSFADAPGAVDIQQGRFSFTFDLSDVSPTPEPGSLVLLGSGLLGALRIYRRRSSSRSLR